MRNQRSGGAPATLLVALAALLPHGGGTRSVAAAATPAVWRETPLVTLASPISDLPGGRFVELGNVFVRPAGEVVFWGKLAGRADKASWGVFSYRGGTIRTILEEGEEVTSRYAAEPGRRFHVHAGGPGSTPRLVTGNLLADSGLFHSPLAFVEGTMLCFNSGSGALMRDIGAYCWDGERIRPAAVPGQTLNVGGVSARINQARAMGAGVGGDLLLFVRTEKPSQLSLSASFDGETLRPLLPPLQGAAKSAVGGGVEGLVSPLWNLTRLLPGGEYLGVVPLGVTRWGRRGAVLVHQTAGGTSTVLETGAPFPFDASRKLADIELLVAQSATRFVTLLHDDKGGGRYAFHEGARILDLTPPLLLSQKSWSFTINQLEFLSADRPLLLFKVQAHLEEKGEQYEGTHFLLFDGQSIRWLTNAPLFDATDRTRIERLTGGPYAGALVHALRGPVPEGKLPDSWPLWFVSANDPAAGLVPVPQLELEGGGGIGLEAVRGWTSDGAAVAVKADGIYRLEASSSTAPPAP